MEKHGSLQAGDTVQIVLKDAGGLDAGDPGIRAMLDEVRSLPSVADVQPPGEGSVSPDGTIGYATVTLDGVAEDVPAEHVTKIIDTAQAAAGDGLQVELGGDAVRNVQEEGGGGAEGAGMLAALVILVLLFGSLHRRGAAAGHRAVRGRLRARPDRAGLARVHRRRLHPADHDAGRAGRRRRLRAADLLPLPARAAARRGPGGRGAGSPSDAAGRTVFFAGCTVIIALLGLVALGLGSLQGVALAVALTVLVTMAGRR